MIRNALISFLLVAIAATAIVTLASNSVFSAQNAQNTTFQTADTDATRHHLVFTKCALEDCSDTQQ